MDAYNILTSLKSKDSCIVVVKAPIKPEGALVRLLACTYFFLKKYYYTYLK